MKSIAECVEDIRLQTRPNIVTRGGCHGLGVCDKAVCLRWGLSERNFMETAKRSVVKWAGSQIQHDVVADSAIVALDLGS